MSDTTILTTTGGKDQFYPTPPELAAQMLEDVDWAMISTVLEPSAGKGDLAVEIAKSYREYDRYGRRELDVDCVELDPNLRQICKYTFSEERIKTFREPYRKLDYMSYSSRTPEQEAERKRLKNEIDTLALSSFVLTVELATRFLDDYILGSPYFKIYYPEHNLVRTRCQIALAKDMLKKMPQMEEIVKKCAAKYC